MIEMLVFGYMMWCAVKLVICMMLNIRHKKHISFLENYYASQYGETIRSYATKTMFSIRPPTILSGIIVFGLFLIPSELGLIAPITLIIGGTYFAPWNRLVTRETRRQTAIDRMNAAQRVNPQPEQDSFSSGSRHEDEDFFSYKGGSDQRSKSASSAMPYGVDKRHPEDTKLWAKVDDPSASDAERSQAFSRILKNQAKRDGGTGRDVARSA